MKVYNFFHNDNFIKSKICEHVKSANKECRELENDYKLALYSIKCKATKELNNDGTLKELL